MNRTSRDQETPTSTMASGFGPRNLGVIGPEFGRQVEFPNVDIQDLVELHYQQSQKSPEETVAQEIDKQLREFQLGSMERRKWNSDYTLPDSKENDEISNNVRPSFQLNSQKHEFSVTETCSEDQFSTSSEKSKSSQTSNKKSNNCKVKPKAQPVQTSILDDIFNTMPPNLKTHRGFVIEKGSGKAFCNVCGVKVEHMFSITEHLKTKAHEDNTILFLKQYLSTDLHETMEFVSFYGSNLCCKLCRCKINLCSDSPHETILNIMTHNAGKEHLSNKASSVTSCKSDEALVILKSLARMNPLVNDNKHFIDFKMQPQFKCKLCDKIIENDQNKSVLLKNFITHFSNEGHSKSLKATLVLKSFEACYLPGEGKHNFIISNSNITCTVCNCPVEADLEQLLLHVTEANDLACGSVHSDLVSRVINMPISSPSTKCDNNSPPILKDDSVENSKKVPPAYLIPLVMETIEPSPKKSVGLNALLNSLPKQLRKVNCLVEHHNGHVMCLICKCSIPPSTYNLETHLKGNNHKKNEQAINLTVVKETPKGVSVKPHGSHFLMDHAASVETYTTYQGWGNGVNSDDDLLFKNDPSFKKNWAKYLTKNNDQYFCKLCKTAIQRSYNEDKFKQNLMFHFSGPKHKENISEILDTEIAKLVSSDRTVRANKHYLEKRGDTLACTLCTVNISLSTDKGSLKSNIMMHLVGVRHTKNKEANMIKETSVPLLVEPVNLRPNYTIEQFFKSLPAHFQDDVAYVKSSPIEGYLSCTLCSCIINPYYLRKHLEEERHVEKKGSQ